MSVSLSSQRRSDVVARLRAAGCVFAEDEARLLISEARTPAELTAMVDRRAAGLPLEHVIGWAEFCGLRIAVDPGVFVPRRRTEFLVSQAVLLSRPPSLARTPSPASPPDPASPPVPAGPPAPARAGAAAARPTGARPVVLDLCCGSGAVGAALAAALGEIELYAADIDPTAVACARRNVAGAGGRVYEGDLYEPLPAALRGRVGLLAANVPYVPAGEVGLLPPEARAHEPRVALDGGADGLDVLRRVIAGAPQWLAPGGHLLSEISDRQAASAIEAVAGGRLVPRVVSSEELNATVIVGTRPAMPPTRPARSSSQAVGG